ncbi:MAG: hypothetical protein QF717_10940 [SAR202 cluster bacterium]|jgi:D-arabinose 1-dehydrogenase-like Zn-dependent alcohol dehydrogenase|nr:hypothetical protein [SAR202 cluster bacterium]MDP7104402.1 hypothetical protein [SAR202 cluster bacterium]MDP7223618.1 hypothetical protein [SAR202 cluster bacterium]
MSEVIQVAVRGLVKPVVTKRVALEDVEEVFDTLSRRTLLGRAAIVVDWGRRPTIDNASATSVGF